MRKRKLFTFLGFMILLFTGCNDSSLVDNSTVEGLSNSLASTGLTSADFLKTNGTFIKKNSGTGSNVFLRGTNAGGWLVQESWMNPTNASDQKTMMSTFTSRFGTSGRDELIDVYEDNFWTTADFDNCANMGMTVIRLPFTYMNLVTDDNSAIKAGGWDRLDWFVENCRSRGMYVILDLHGAFGSQNGMDHSGEVNDGKQLWWNDDNKGKTKWLWWQIANHFKGNPAVAAYDILNEPGIKAAATYSLQWDFYDQIYDVIRGVDADHIIIMESCWDAANLPRPSVYGWTNVVYEYHYYPWNYVSNYSGQVSYVDSKVSNINNAGYGVPTFVGEFTCFGLADAWKYTLNAYNNQGWHWTSWAYKATGSNTSWGIYNHTPSTVDIYNDSKATIKSKWATVGASSTWKNTTVYNAMVTGLKQTSTATIANGAYYFKGVNTGKIVCADNSGANPLIANRSSYGGAWETLNIVNNSDGTVSLKSGANNLYVCMVNDENKQLLARSSTIGTWEKFYLVKVTNTQFALKSYVNNLYVTVNQNNSNILYATANTIEAWEVFNVYTTGGAQITN
jgi:Endoglucanase